MRSSRTTHVFVLVGLLLFCSLSISGQRLVRSISNGTLEVDKINKRLDEAFKGLDVPKTDVSIDLRKLTYTTTDENGKTVNVTGLLAMPEGGAPKGLVVFMHGTMWDRKTSPSRFTPKTGAGETELAVLAFATAGYAVAAPDYLGLGDNMAVHPYPMNILNARAGADIIVPARTAAGSDGYRIGPKLFVTGYSEGGGTAMGLTKLLEERRGSMFRVERSAPASGPYDLSGVTRDFLLEDVSGEAVIIRAYLLGYCITYFHKVHGVKTSDYFTKAMAMTVNGAFKEGRSDKSIAVRLAVMGTLTGSTRSVEKLLTKRFINALETLDTSDPVIRELIANDVYDWSPQTPMLLINLATDKVVDPGNTRKAIQAMRRRGVGTATLRHLEINNPELDHGTVMPEALFSARKFFDGGFAAVPTAK